MHQIHVHQQLFYSTLYRVYSEISAIAAVDVRQWPTVMAGWWALEKGLLLHLPRPNDLFSSHKSFVFCPFHVTYFMRYSTDLDPGRVYTWVHICNFVVDRKGCQERWGADLLILFFSTRLWRPSQRCFPNRYWMPWTNTFLAAAKR